MKKINVEKLIHNIDTRMASDLENNNVNAVSLLVMQEGQILYTKNYGLADENTLFRLASMTKPITSVAVMMLYDKGLIDIDDPVDKFLPQFSEMYLAEVTENKDVIKAKKLENKLTVKHLLTHTSGILNGDTGAIYYTKMTGEQNRTLANAVDFYADCGVDFVPFTKQEYNAAAAFDVLARIVEIVSEMDYEEYLKKYIFTPLEMKNTTFVPSDDQWKRIVQMHDKQDGKSTIGQTWEGCVFEGVPVTHYLGGAGLISSLEDYSHFAEMLLNRGEFSGTRILSEKAIEMISTPYVPEEIMPLRERWGLGVRVITIENYKLPVGAYGWSGAYGTHFWVDDENKITAIYLKNSRFDGGSGAVTADNFELDVFNSLE